MTFHGFEKGTVVPATIPRQNTALFLLFRFQLSKYLIFRHDSPSVIFWRYNPLLSGIPHKEQHRLLHRGLYCGINQQTCNHTPYLHEDDQQKYPYHAHSQHPDLPEDDCLLQDTE